MNLFSVDPREIRTRRQVETNQALEQMFVRGGSSVKELKKHANFKEFDRVCEQFGLSQQEMLGKLKENQDLSKMAAGRIAINSSRQSSSDEKFLIEGISEALSADTDFIIQKPDQEIRFTRDGRILTRKEFKKEKLHKDADGLKSVDATIYEQNNLRGYVFAKILYGKGGHQDNVKREMNEFIEWAHQYGDESLLYVCLIDTDHDISEYTKKQTNNIWVVNHVELQQRLRS